MNKLFVIIINNFHVLNNMKNQKHNSNLSSREVSIQQLNAKQTVETIQSISKNVREYALQMQQTMRTLRESGAIPEVALAIRDGSFAARDIAKDISQTTRDLKRNGVIHETASAVETTLKSAEDSVMTVKDLAKTAKKASPHTVQVVSEGVDTVKKEAEHVAEMVNAAKSRVTA